MLPVPLSHDATWLGRVGPATVRGMATAGSLSLAWWLLALLALGASTLCAVLLVVARTPFLARGAEFFRMALVLHVDLAVVVWFLAVAAGLWLKALPVRGGLAGLARGGFWLAGGGVLAMLVSPFDPASLPILANYVPVLDGSLFYLGLAAVLSGVGLAGLASLAGLIGGAPADAAVAPPAYWRWPVVAAIIAFLAADLVFLLAWRAAPGEVSLDGRWWGGGHVLQVVHTLMLMAAWLYLGRQALARVALGHRCLLALVGSELLAVLADLLIALAFPVDSPAYRAGFTAVMRWATWPAPVILAVSLLLGYARQFREQRLNSLDCYLLASIGLFLLGCVVGAGIRGETTTVPAHYHGTVGAVTLAYMVWARSYLADFGLVVRQGRLWRWQPLIYGLGIGLMVLGLAWAGSLGVARKAPHVDSAASAGMQHVAMGLAGCGGLLATSGAAIFVLGILLAIWKKRNY